MQVVIVLVPPGEIALRTSATTSGRYGGRIKHTDKDSYGYVGQLVAVGNLPIVELIVEIVKHPLRNIETLSFRYWKKACRTPSRNDNEYSLYRLPVFEQVPAYGFEKY